MSEVNQRVRSNSPKGRAISPEQAERRKNAAEGFKKRNTKQADFFDKYAYHLVIGGFVALCVVAFGSTLLKGSKKLSTIPVIDEEEIASHNQQGYSYTLGSNELFQGWMLSDAKYILNNHLTFKSQIAPCAEDQTIIPPSFNFRTEFPNCAQEVYNQGNCSSSYAIAATSAVSDRVCKVRGETFRAKLSPQAPLSCDKQKNFGCTGGSVSRVFDYARKNGLVDSDCMEFVGKDDNSTQCEETTQCEKYRVLDYCVASNEENIKREIYKNGPVVAVMPIYKDFLVYQGGVYQIIEGTSRFQQGHAVKLIGWGTNDNGQSYWIVENSWGESWGDKGLAYVGTGQPDLLLERYVLAPTVENFNTPAQEEQQQPEVEVVPQTDEPVIRDD